MADTTPSTPTQTTPTTKLPDTIENGRKEDTKKKNTETDDVKYNKDVHLEGGVTVIELKGGNEIKNPKEFVEERAKIEANRLGRPVKVKLKMPKKGGGGGSGGGGSPRDPGSAESGNNFTKSAGNNFDSYSPTLMGRLMSDYGLTRNQAAGIVGNLGHESRGLTPGIQEGKPISGRGGLGWAQWTGPRRRQFESYLARTGQSASSPEANYGFLKTELDGDYAGSIRAVKQQSSAYGSMRAFESSFEKAGIKHYASREYYTNRALQNGVNEGGTPSQSSGGGGGGGQGGDDEETYESKEAKPDGRDDDINKRAMKKDEGDTDEAKKLRKPPEMGKRSQKGFNKPYEGVLGIKDDTNEGSDQGAGAGDGGQLDNFNDFKGGVPREFSGVIPPMESLLMNLPNQALGQFVKQIPGPLQGLIPPGLVPGISGNSPVSLNGLMQLVGGGALGQAAGQLIRSTSGGINLPQSLPGLQGIPANRAFGNPQIPNSSTAAIANSIGTISRVATNKGASGVPVDLSTLTRSIQLVLRNSGMGVPIPTNVLGIAGMVASQALGAVLSQALGGLLGGMNIPILPSNLSIPNAALISGLSQFLPPGVAQNIFTVGQLSGLLPGNLQNQIPTVSPSISSGGVPNVIEQNRNASPEIAPNTNNDPGQSGQPGNQGGGQGGGNKYNGKEEEGTKGSTGGGRYINYDMKISKYLTLAQVTTHVLVKGHKLVPMVVKGKSYSVDELIENLSAVAKNCYDPIHDRWGPVHVNSGFRENSQTDHGKGCALDLSFGRTHAYIYEVAKWCADGNIPFRQIILEREAKPPGWLHVAYKKGEKAGAPLMTQIPGTSGANSRFNHSLINYYGNK